MRLLLRLLIAATTVPFALSSPNPFSVSGGRSGADALYRSCLDKALVRARDELERSLKLTVDHSSWEDPWIVEHGPFRVRSTASWYVADRAAKNLGTMVAHFEALLDRPFPTDEVRNVFIFPDIGGYNGFGSPYGVHSSIFGSFYAGEDAAQPVATYYHPNSVQMGMWLTHSASHMYLARRAARQLPTWMDEGLASYFAFYFWAYDYGVDELERIIADGRFLPLDELLSADLAEYQSDTHERFVELAMLFAYLIHHGEGTASPLDDVREGSFVEYLQKAVRGERLTHHPMHDLLEGGRADLEQDFREFVFPRF